MSFSLLNLFKRKAPAAAPVSARPAAEKANGERLSKTVMPNSARVQARPQEAFSPNAAPVRMALPTAVAEPAAPRVVSLGRSGSAPSPVAPPEATGERSLPLKLADVVAQMPEGFVRTLTEAEGNRRVSLKAAELERGMSNGRPSVSVLSIYRQAPDIFMRPVAEDDETQVSLPFAKVMEQFAQLQLRADQYHEQPVPQVETPFLQVTIEDNTKFGTKMSPLQTDALPPVKVQPAVAETIAAAEPEPVAQIKVNLPPPAPAPVDSAPPVVPNEQMNGNGHASTPPPAPTQIPFKISLNGAGASAAERVPASGRGASVPTSAPPPPPPPAGPARIPFKLASQNGAAKTTASTNGRAPAALAPAPKTSRKTELKISLPLKLILETLPPIQIAGDISAVPEDARLELPFSLVEPQLVSGRVSVTPEEFAAALPEEFRGCFNAKDVAAPIALPLQEVLVNLPAATLRMREDQEEQERGADFVTPFSATAEEDAKRLQVSAAPVAKPVAPAAEPAPAPGPLPMPQLAPVATELPKPAVKLPVASAAPVAPKPDGKAIIAQIEALPGVAGAALLFGDGLSLAGALPESLKMEGLCALAPTFLQRVENHLVDTKLGALRTMTLTCAEGEVSFSMLGNLCLALLHADSALSSEVRTKISTLVEEISQTYSHPA